MPIFPFAAGAFMATYMNNPKFKASVDKSVQKLLARGVSALNQRGDDYAELAEPEPSGQDGGAGGDSQPGR